MEQFLFVALEHARYRDAGPVGYQGGDDLGVHYRVNLLLFEPLLLALLVLLAAPAWASAQYPELSDARMAAIAQMLPDIPAERIRFVGNTSIAGAKMALVSRTALEKAEEIAGRMTYFDLMNHPTYMEEFIRSNFLPYTDLARFPSAEARLARRGGA